MKKKVCLVVSSLFTVKAFLTEHIAALARSYEVTVVANTADPALKGIRLDGVEVIHAPIVRRISPLRDIRALAALFRIFREEHFALVHSVTPKAGLLAMAAGWLARIPVRLHTFTGQVWVTRHGLMRHLLKNLDRLLVVFSNGILVDSFSQRQFIIDEGVVTVNKSEVLANGSICGIDTNRFRPDPQARGRIRREAVIPENALLFLYVGRLNREKGVVDLAGAFAALCRERQDVHLMLVGPDEEGIREGVAVICRGCAGQLHFVEFTASPEKYMAAADVLCLPSYREGFGSVVIEAAAVGIPAIASRIYGITDAVVDGETGILHRPGAEDEIKDCLLYIIDNPESRARMAGKARSRARQKFDQGMVTAALVDYYGRVLRGVDGAHSETSL